MIRSIERAWQILEFVSNEPDSPKTISEIAEAVQIPVATCGRILQTLGGIGCIEQLEPRQGFMLGPMAYLLASRGSYRKYIVRVAEPLMVELAAQAQETIVLSTVYRGKRLSLSEVDGGQAVQIRGEVVRHDDLYESASGRLLLALMSPEEQALEIRRIGLPGARWNEADTEKRLRGQLDTIRAEGMALLRTMDGVVHVAYPIFEGSHAVAAIGSLLPEHRFVGTRKSALLEGLRKIAEETGQELARRSEFGKGEK